MLKDALGSYRGTLYELNRLIRRDKGNAMVWYDRANLRHGIGDHTGAVADYTRALEIGLRKREELLALGNRAMALSEIGRYEEALMDCSGIIDANPQNRGLMKAALLRRAEMYGRMGRNKEASRDVLAAEQLTIRKRR